jgi:hypothetical protein
MECDYASIALFAEAEGGTATSTGTKSTKSTEVPPGSATVHSYLCALAVGSWQVGSFVGSSISHATQTNGACLVLPNSQPTKLQTMHACMHACIVQLSTSGSATPLDRVSSRSFGDSGMMISGIEGLMPHVHTSSNYEWEYECECECACECGLGSEKSR